VIMGPVETTVLLTGNGVGFPILAAVEISNAWINGVGVLVGGKPARVVPFSEAFKESLEVRFDQGAPRRDALIVVSKGDEAAGVVIPRLMVETHGPLPGTFQAAADTLTTWQ